LCTVLDCSACCLGYGGIWPGDPNAKKYKVTIKSKTTGEEYTADVPSDRYIYFYFEEQGIGKDDEEARKENTYRGLVDVVDVCRSLTIMPVVPDVSTWGM
jgi:hypothetical protein